MKLLKIEYAKEWARGVFLSVFLSFGACKKNAGRDASEGSPADIALDSERAGESADVTEAGSSPPDGITAFGYDPESADVLVIMRESTGRFPEVWEGRDAMEEERRLREEGVWVQEKLGFFREWATVDPAAAIRASRQADKLAISACTVAAVKGWGATDFKQARDWVSSQPANVERAMFAQALYDVTRSDDARSPESMARWMAGEVGTPGIAPLLGEFVTEWGERDREASVAWVKSQLTNPNQRREVLEIVIRNASLTGDKAFEETAEWIQTQEPGLFSDELFHAFVKEAALFDPEASRHWAELIGDEGLRAKALGYCKPGDWRLSR